MSDFTELLTAWEDASSKDRIEFIKELQRRYGLNLAIILQRESEG